MKIPYFENINTDPLKEYYRTVIDFEGRKLQLDLNFEKTLTDEEHLTQVKIILENLKIWNEKAKQLIYKEFQTGTEVDDYLEFHLEELFEEDLEKLLENADETLSQREQVLSILILKRIGFYPGVENYHAIFDFAVEADSNQVLVVIFNKKGEFDHITWES